MRSAYSVIQFVFRLQLANPAWYEIELGLRAVSLLTTVMCHQIQWHKCHFSGHLMTWHLITISKIGDKWKILKHKIVPDIWNQKVECHKFLCEAFIFIFQYLLQGVSKKRYFFDFYFISVLEVRFNFFTCVLESEFRAHSILQLKLYLSEIQTVLKMQNRMLKAELIQKILRW